jgi:hypothetical protein
MSDDELGAKPITYRVDIEDEGEVRVTASYYLIESGFIRFYCQNKNWTTESCCFRSDTVRSVIKLDDKG